MKKYFKLLEKIRKPALFIGLFSGFLLVSSSPIDALSASYIKPSYKIRVTHARELMGKQYAQSVVCTGERVTNIEGFVETVVYERLPGRYTKYSSAISKAIIDEANKHGFDPLFLAAVIARESRFNVKARGRHGEIGLMQIKPQTAKWIAHKHGISYRGALSLENPVTNIKIGAQYLAKLRDKFGQPQLYVSAYNMGVTNVNRVLKRNIQPTEYKNSVMTPYLSMYEQLKNHEDTKAAQFRSRATLAFNDN